MGDLNPAELHNRPTEYNPKISQPAGSGNLEPNEILAGILYDPSLGGGGGTSLLEPNEILAGTIYAAKISTTLLPLTLDPTAITGHTTYFNPSLSGGASGSVLSPTLIRPTTLHDPEIELLTPDVLGPYAIAHNTILYWPSLGTPPIPTNCWTMEYDYDDDRWLLIGGNGLITYGMSEEFDCDGKNIFDVILKNNCVGDVPDSIPVYPLTNTTCDCAPPVGCCKSQFLCVTWHAPGQLIDGLKVKLKNNETGGSVFPLGCEGFFEGACSFDANCWQGCANRDCLFYVEIGCIASLAYPGGKGYSICINGCTGQDYPYFDYNCGTQTYFGYSLEYCGEPIINASFTISTDVSGCT